VKSSSIKATFLTRFYLVRRGCIKVTQTQPGGELVLTYLARKIRSANRVIAQRQADRDLHGAGSRRSRENREGAFRIPDALLRRIQKPMEKRATNGSQRPQRRGPPRRALIK